jgi:hypothetical protein
MEPLHNPNERAPRPSDYRPKRSRWPGLLGATAIVAAVMGVAMWAQHDDARKAPQDKGASVTVPAQPATGTNPPPSDDSQVATQPAPARQ